MLENIVIFSLLIFGVGVLIAVHINSKKKKAKRKEMARQSRNSNESVASQNVATTMALSDDFDHQEHSREEDLEVLNYLRDENPDDDVKPEPSYTYEEPVEHRITQPTPQPEPSPAPVERSEPSVGYGGDSSGGGDTGGGGGGE